MSWFRVSPGSVLGFARLPVGNLPVPNSSVHLRTCRGEQPATCSPFLPFASPGVFRGGHDLLVRARLVLTDTVTMQVTARSPEELPVDVIMASVG